MKKTLYEILGIVLIAGAFGLVYNEFTTNPMPLVMEEKKVDYVDDRSLDSLFTSPADTNINPAAASNPATQTESKDTSAKAANPKDTAKTVAPKETEKPTAEITSKEPQSIKYDQLVKYMNRQDVILVDARSSEIFDAGHIGKAVNIHPYDDPPVYMGKLLQLPQNKVIVIYCDGGNCDLSHHVAKDLINYGYSKVLIYTGGWEEWLKKHPKS